MLVDEFALRHGVYATLMYFVLYFALLLNQSFTGRRLAIKYRKLKKPFSKYYNVTDRELLRADRAVGNTLEQMPVFLTLYWLAIFASSIKNTGTGTPSSVALSGYVYVLGRLLYLPLWLISGSSPRGLHPMVLISTVPCYLVQIFCALALFNAVQQ
ncbi:hypothetical protein PTSG_04365 [Salpingoeca rosetta]|uniref:MAPEG family protein n=1 Tax=Salpingoeca rosetta (strain ATCC 50818 / BSB-021) TaxID=946362 RepID=F2U8C2_SALR5|nr:uncharacterized protein PTSG_04365 [Salpingoeca rosetta]EGD72630.1 hypothetical protein PTSG_04365 [Salpingoeca rosetta]|eukprot:XP_004994453.1 hypothetical protein PTSG_04365 [Salpingoeca rosetta]